MGVYWVSLRLRNLENCGVVEVFGFKKDYCDCISE